MLPQITTKVDTETLRKLEDFSGKRDVNNMSDKELIAYYHAQLCLIAQIQIDDDEEIYPNDMTGETEYVWLTHGQARQNLDRAVLTARETVKSWGKL